MVEETEGMELRIGFAGGLVEAATGAVRVGARDYLPGVGRWLSKDKLMFVGGLSLYVYVDQQPENYIDASGNAKQKPFHWDECKFYEDKLMCEDCCAEKCPGPPGRSCYESCKAYAGCDNKKSYKNYRCHGE